MRKVFSLFRITFSLLYALFFTGCLKEDAPGKLPESPQLLESFPLPEARVAFESLFSGVYSSPLLRGGEFTKSNISPLSENWISYLSYEDEYSVVYEIPLTPSTSLSAGLLNRENGKSLLKTAGINYSQHLVLQKSKEKDTARFFVVSVIGEAPANNCTYPYYTGDRTGFKGFLIISSPDGKLLCSYYYENNRCRRVRLRTGFVDTLHSHISGFRIFEPRIVTKGFNYGDDQYCRYCGAYIGDTACSSCSGLPPVDVWGESVHCDFCGYYKANCRCNEVLCIFCNDYPCQCCQRCFNYPCCCSEYQKCSKCGEEYCNGECGKLTPDNPPPVFYYTVTLVPSGEGFVYGGGRYHQGTSVCITAVSAIGHTFGGWVDEWKRIITTENPTIVINIRDMTLAAHFYPIESECAKLSLNYRKNNSLRNVFDLLNQKKAGNNREYVYLLNSQGEYDFFAGEEGRVSFDFNKYSSYQFIVHNHSLSPIPSPEDILAVYKAYKGGKMGVGNGIIMQMEEGTMSIEIEDGSMFEEFIWEYFGEVDLKIAVNKDVLSAYYIFFQKDILNSPNNHQLKNKEVIDKAIQIYASGKGLRVAYIPGDGRDYDWSYAKMDSNVLSFENCIK